MGLLLCRQAQLQQGHEDYQSGAKREQREQERRRADQARDAERKTREEVCACQFTFVLVMKQFIGRSYTLVQVPCDSMRAQVTAATVFFVAWHSQIYAHAFVPLQCPVFTSNHASARPNGKLYIKPQAYLLLTV